MQNIVLAFNSDILPGAKVTIVSALLSNREMRIKFTFLDGGLTNMEKIEINQIIETHGSERCEINWIRFNQSSLSHLVSHQEFTHMTYARILIANLLDEKSCIYIDSDFLITTDLYEINQENTNTLLAACLDGDGSSAGEYPWHQGEIKSPYINAGIMWINLEEWRKNKITEEILNFLNIESARCRWADQTAINWVLRDRIKILDSRFNKIASQIDSGKDFYIAGKSNIHFASGLKPWKRPLPTLSHSLWRHFNKKHTPDNRYKFLTINNIARYARYLIKRKWLVIPFDKKACFQYNSFKRFTDFKELSTDRNEST